MHAEFSHAQLACIDRTQMPCLAGSLMTQHWQAKQTRHQHKTCIVHRAMADNPSLPDAEEAVAARPEPPLQQEVTSSQGSSQAGPPPPSKRTVGAFCPSVRNNRMGEVRGPGLTRTRNTKSCNTRHPPSRAPAPPRSLRVQNPRELGLHVNR